MLLNQVIAKGTPSSSVLAYRLPIDVPVAVMLIFLQKLNFKVSPAYSEIGTNSFPKQNYVRKKC
jgi:hypothetical protein